MKEPVYWQTAYARFRVASLSLLFSLFLSPIFLTKLYVLLSLSLPPCSPLSFSLHLSLSRVGSGAVSHKTPSLSSLAPASERVRAPQEKERKREKRGGERERDREGGKERTETEAGASNQAGRQTGRHAGSKAGRQASKQASRQASRQADRKAGRQEGRKADR